MKKIIALNNETEDDGMMSLADIFEMALFAYFISGEWQVQIEECSNQSHNDL